MEEWHARKREEAETQENSNQNEQVKKYTHSITILACSLAV
jgi:hypothetical protein